LVEGKVPLGGVPSRNFVLMLILQTFHSYT